MYFGLAVHDNQVGTLIGFSVQVEEAAAQSTVVQQAQLRQTAHQEATTAVEQVASQGTTLPRLTAMFSIHSLFTVKQQFHST